MALDTCVCPAGVLPSIPVDSCSEGFSTIRTMIFQLPIASNDFVTVTNGIEEASSWTGLSAAVDDTKVSIIKGLKDVIFSEVEFVTGTENYDGAETIDGVKPQIVTAILENPTPAVSAAIDTLACHNQTSDLGVFFIDRNSKIRANIFDASPLTHRAIVISQGTFARKTPSRQGNLHAKSILMFQFALNENWFDNSDVVTAEAGFDMNNDIQP